MLSKTDVRPFTDLKFRTPIKDRHISSLKVKVIGQMSRSPRSKCKSSSFQSRIRKCGPRSWSQRLRSKVKVVGQGQSLQGSKSHGQGPRVKVKVVGGVFYPVDSWEVREVLM